jgi:ATP-dependent DNA ligase
MEMHERYILSQVDGIDITAVVAGSYRRGKGESGDIDVLVRDNLCSGPQVYQDLIKRLRASNYLVDDIVYGKNKYNGYCRHPDLLDNRRIDIMYTKPEEYAFALFYFTGSGDFNQELRGQLSKLGYRLNEHGIKKLVGDTWEPVAIPCTGKVSTEKDIFKFLGIPYIAPQYRSRESLLKVSKGGTMLIPQRKSEPLVPNYVVRSGSKLTTSMERTTKPKRLKISQPSSPKSKPKRLKISGGTKTKTKLQSLAPDSRLDIGQTTQIDGHTIKKTSENSYYCDCSQWRFQSLPPNLRKCKHIKQLTDYTTFTPTIKKKSGFEPLLANKWKQDSNDPTGWWMSEKLDGIRAIWDGTNLFSRLGNSFPAPKWFTDKLPKSVVLDGELFTKRQNFQETISIVKNSGLGQEWKKIKFMVFDIPSIKENKFEQRQAKITEILSSTKFEHLQQLKQTRCKGTQHCLDILDKIIKVGGEGVMLRQPSSLYVNGRSNTLLKVKMFYDAEAIVIGHSQGNGRNAERLGALVCKMDSGKQFRIGTGFSDEERRNPPKIGSIVTYKFQELTNSKVPRFPSYVGIRIDADSPKDFIP